jgi:8-oxo-dGTP diphosphatase
VEKFSTPMLVVAAALIASDGRVLMQRRRFDAVHGGLWEFPGGKVDAGESPESALVRELGEELEITPVESDLMPLAFASGQTAPQAGSRPLVILLYTCTAWQGEPRCVEGSQFGWFEHDEIATLAMPPLDYPLASRLAQTLFGHVLNGS